MVEIIPKPTTRLPSWQNIISYFSIGLVLLVVLSYFALDIYYLDKAETKLAGLEEELKQKTAEEIALEQEISRYEKKIQIFSILIDRYLFSSRVFGFIEKNTHPEAWFSSLNLNPRKGEVSLSGDTENFVTLHQQVQIFKDDSSVQGLNLTKIAIGKEGRIDFDLSLILDPGLFKLNE